MVVHLHTRISTVFGVLDDDGNVIPGEPVVADLSKFSEAQFVEAHAGIAAARDRLAAETSQAG